MKNKNKKRIFTDKELKEFKKLDKPTLKVKKTFRKIMKNKKKDWPSFYNKIIALFHEIDLSTYQIKVVMKLIREFYNDQQK